MAAGHVATEQGLSCSSISVEEHLDVVHPQEWLMLYRRKNGRHSPQWQAEGKLSEQVTAAHVASEQGLGCVLVPVEEHLNVVQGQEWET